MVRRTHPSVASRNTKKPSVKKQATANPSPSRLRKSATSKSRISVLTDQVRQLKAEIETLSRERQLLRTLLDHVPDSIYFKDSMSRFIRVNRAWADRRGIVDRSSVVGKSDFDFFSKEYAAASFADEQRIIETGEPLIGKIERQPGLENQVRWVSTTKVPLVNSSGAIVGTCGITRDITQVIKTEEALEKERNLLRTLIDTMPDYIFVKDAESRFIINNRSHLRCIGVSRQEEILNKTDFDVFPRDLAARYFSDEQIVLQTGRSIVGREEPVKLGSSAHAWLSTTKVAVRDGEGRITGLVGISRDITERKVFEEALKRAKDELEIRVEERTADLKMANERLETRLSQLKFLNTSSYELAQFIRIEELAPAIVDSFVSRLPTGSQASLSLRDGARFKLLSATSVLSTEKGKSCVLASLEMFADRELQRPMVIEDWRQDEYARGFEWPEGIAGLPCHIIVPLLADNKSIAIVQVFSPQSFLVHYEPEQTVLTTLAAHAAACLSNAIHYQEVGERGRLQGELDAARSIQRRFTPQGRPDVPHVNMKGVYYPAFEVGGDYLDYFQVENGKWVVVIADVCGKGIPAALFMTMLRSTFRVEARTNASAKSLLCAVNESMRVNLDDKSFVTALCLVIDSDGHSMTYARAGHPMLLQMSREHHEPVNVKCSGIALGLVSDPGMFASMVEEVTIPLREGDRFLVYTDGLTEATDPEKASYGTKRLFDLLARTTGGPDVLIQTIMHDVKGFCRGAPYHDDLTILAMEILPE